MNGMNSRLDTTEGKTHKLENMEMINIQNEWKRQK